MSVKIEKHNGGLIAKHSSLPRIGIAIIPLVKRKVILRLGLTRYNGDIDEWTLITPTFDYEVGRLHVISSSRSSIFKTFYIAACNVGTELIMSEAAFEMYMTEIAIELQQHEWEEEEPEIDLDAKITTYVKPSGFYESAIIEPIYVPQIRQQVTLGRAVMIRTTEGFGIKPYRDGMEIDGLIISGMFPSPRMTTLPSKNVPKAIIQSGKDITLNKEMLRNVDSLVDTALRKHLFIDEDQLVLMKRFIEASYFYDMMDAFPLLNIIGSSENGKTRALMCIAAMAYHGDFLVDPTEAVLFRNKEMVKPTLCIDEAEYLNDKETRGRIKLLLNASYSRDAGYVMRAERGTDGSFELMRFDLYSPVAIAGISGLYGVLRSRSIPLVMPRANNDYPKAKIEDYGFFRDCMYVIRMLHGFKVKELFDKTLESQYEGIDARYFELFRPLIVATYLFGTDKEMEMIIRIAQQIRQNERNEAETNINEEQMVLQVLDIIVQQTGSWYSLEDVLTQLQLPPHQVSWRAAKISTILRRMGIIQRKRIESKTHFYTTREEVDGLLYKYGVRVSDE